MAEEADGLKTAFLRTMSHELRTPLNAIMGYAHLLLDGFEGALAPRQEAGGQQIAGGVDRLLALVNDVVDPSRIQAGMLELAIEPVDLAGAVTAVLAEQARPTAAAWLVLRSDVPDGLAVSADVRRLHQVLLDLVGNAAEFTEAGEVQVAAHAVPGKGVEVAVRDTGIGIPRELPPRVFDEFRQADGSTTRTYGGTELGLAITGQLVELQGGGGGREARGRGIVAPAAVAGGAPGPMILRKRWRARPGVHGTVRPPAAASSCAPCRSRPTPPNSG